MRHSWKRLSALLLAAVMVASMLPTAALAAKSSRTETTINVTDYGADPTGMKESSTAVIAALAAAKELPEGDTKTIVFPKGEYHFYEDYSLKKELYVSNTLKWGERAWAMKNIGILVEGMKNVVIDGGGSMFIYHGNVTTMAAIDSENVTFQNFSEDFASPEVVDVTVTAHEGDNAAIIFIPACYNYTISSSGTDITWKGDTSPVTGQPYWTWTNGELNKRQYLDTLSGCTTGGTYPFSNVSSITKVDDTHIKVVYSNASSRPPVGQCCQMRHPNPRKTAGVFFWQSKNITLLNANFHYLHGFGIVGQLSETITLDTVKCQARPGTGRTSAGFADFVQMSSVGGKVTITDCEFADPHDDPINIHGTFLKITDISTDSTKVEVRYMNDETWGFPQYYEGDTVDFSTQGSLTPVANLTRTVKSVANPGEGLNLNGTQRSKDNEDDMKTIVVEFNEALPNTITANNYVMENVTYTPEVLIENCRFVEVPTRAILVTTRQPVVIRNNFFDRMGMASIFISCDASGWWESGRTEDVLIENNVFNYSNAAAILVGPTGNGSPGNRVHKNMRIKNNTFNMVGNQTAVNALSVDGLTIEGNLIQRYTPNVSMTLAAASQSLNVGEAQSTTLAASGTSFNTRVYNLQHCENVTIKNNTYDDGLNLGVSLNNTTSDDVTLTGDDLTLGGNKQLPAVGAVSYFSSKPDVATVDSTGVVTGVKAGEAEIYAYRMAGGRGFESNHLTFTVSGTAATKPDKIEVTSDESTVDVGGTLSLTANVTGPTGSVAWSVKPITTGATATITQGGVLTATAPGVVEVTASLGGVTGSKLVTVSKPGYEYLSDLSWTGTPTMGNGGSAPKLDKAWSDIEIKLKNSAGDIETFAKGLGVHAPAEITYDLTGKGYTRFTAKVGVSQAADDVVKSGEAKLKFTVLGNGSELFSSSGTQMTKSDAYQGIDVGISNVNTLVIKTTDPTGNNYSAHGNWADAKLYTNNQAPTASAVTVTKTDPLQVTYTYNDADSDAQTGTVIAWYVADGNGHYTRVENASGATLPVTGDISLKQVKAVVVPRDATGRCGAPVTSAAVQAPAQTVVQNDATLRSLSVAGLTLSPAFRSDVTEYTVNAPASVASVTVAAEANQSGAREVTGTGTVNLSTTGATTTVNVVVTAPDGTTTETYTVKIQRPLSSNAALSALSAAAGDAHINFDPATRFYQMEAAQTATMLKLSLTKADSGATVAVRFNSVEKGEYEGEMSLPLAAGLNNLELRVTAADGVSTALYRVAVTKPASADATLKTLTVGGEDVLTSMVARPSSNTVSVVAETTDPKATVTISVDGKAVASGGSVTLTEAQTPATVRVVAEDGATEARYEILIIKNNPADATLYTLDVGGAALTPAFDPAVTEYSMRTANGRPTLTALASQSGAKVSYETYAEYVTDQPGGVTEQVSVFKDADVDNKVVVTVTAPDGVTKKTYTVNITPLPNEIYLCCDLEWDKTTVRNGWESIRKHYDVDPDTNNKLSLLENGQEVIYDHGLGTHVYSFVEYDLTGLGYSQFNFKVGMDHSQSGATWQGLRFNVELDGVNKYTSAELGVAMNCEAPANGIDIAGYKRLTLIAQSKSPNNNGNGHADWADPKLTGSLLSKATTPITAKELTLDKSTATVYTNAGANHTATLTANVKPLGAAGSVSWSTLDTDIVSVENGVVTGLRAGTATVTATAGGKSATCAVTVKSTLGGNVVIIQSAPKFDDTLEVNVGGVTPEAARTGLTYQWFRGDNEIPAPAGTQSTYKVGRDDMNKTIKVKVTAGGSLYEGNLTSDPTAQVGKKAGPAAPQVQADSENAKITGLTAGTAYEIQKDNGDWEDAELTGTEITGLEPGLYKVRVKVDTDVQEEGAASSGLVILPPGVEAYAVNVADNIANGTVTVSKSLEEAGEEITITTKPDPGYTLKSVTVTKVSGGEVEVVDGVFTMPAENVTVTAEFEAQSYTIHHKLEDIECEMHNADHTICHGETQSMTLTAAEGFEMPETAGATGIQVKEADHDAWHNFTYTRSADKKTATLVINGTDVVSDLTVSGSGVPIKYNIGHNLTGLNCDLGDKAAHKVGYHEALEITLTPTNAQQFAVPERITITMGGVELTADEDYTYKDGVINIAEGKITGDLVITAVAVKQPIAMKGVDILGSFKVGRELTARPLPVNATVTYQWYRVDGGVATPITGATGDKYTLTEAELGKQIRVEATGTGEYGGKVSSLTTTTVLEADALTIDVEGMSLNRFELELAVGRTFTLEAIIAPADATNTRVYWSSDNEAVATVSSSGVVTGVAEGTATIKATAADNSEIFDTCAVTVTKAAPAPSGGGSGVDTTTTTTTTTTDDGSKVTTVTAPDGTVTETTEKTDGTVAVVETKTDGTVTATVAQPDGTTSESVTTPEGDKTITVTDADGEELVKVELPAEIPAPEVEFEDLSVTPWAEEAINKVAGLGLVNGIGGNKYDPATPMTRGSLATVLHRLSQGKTDYAVAFTDVAEGKYYTEGVAWAAKAKVVNGYTADIFAPDDIITREQLAVMMARYAKLIGLDTKADAKSLEAFVDGESTGAWAVDGMAWCVENGILKGKGQNNLDPTANVSRAEVAVMLDRFIALIQK